jgi:Zn-finger protein
MKNIMLKALLILLVLFGTYGPVPDSFAIDPPHDVTNDISCTSLCHLTASPAPAWRSQPTGTPTIDYTYANNLCKACHIPTYPMSPQAQDVQTHSSAQTTTTYGTWVIECRTCHDPHYQKQVAAYPISTLNSIVTGTVLTVASNRYSLTVSTALTPSAYIDYVLVPNTAYPTRLYRITDNSATTIMVSPKDPFDTSLVQPNAPFVIRYPGLVKDQISTPNSGTRTVRFFNNQGPRSFATSTTTIDGICQSAIPKRNILRTTGQNLTRGIRHPAA